MAKSNPNLIIDDNILNDFMNIQSKNDIKNVKDNFFNTMPKPDFNKNAMFGFLKEKIKKEVLNIEKMTKNDSEVIFEKINQNMTS